MTTTAELFDQAVRLHQAGQLAQAEPLYRQVLQLDSRHAPALHLLGVLAHQIGRNDAAIPLIRQAIGINDRQPAFYSNLGEAYRASRRYAEAQACYQKALQLSPGFVAAHHNLGMLLHSTGQLAEAKAHYETAIRLQPNHVEAHNSLGNLLRSQGRLSEAVASYRAALQFRPQYAEALNNLGAVQVDLKQFAEAIEVLELSRQLQGGSAETHHNLGNAYKGLRQRDKAIECFQEALRIRPDFVEPRINWGMALQEQGDFAEAIECFQNVLARNPAQVDALNDLGLVYQQQNSFAKARECFENALRLQPDYAPARHSMGVLSLLQGDYERGWAECEWRKAALKDYHPPQPAWDGSPLPHGTILMVAEGGLGDTWQFIRYVSLVQERVGTVMLMVHPATVPLLRASGLTNVLTAKSVVPPCDVHVLFMSLPYIFNTRIDTIPSHVPYISPDAGLVEVWRQRLARFEGFKIGINWQGNPAFASDALRSVPLINFAPLAKVPDVQLISLQQQFGLEQLPSAREQFTIHELGEDVDKAAGAFMDTAAIMKNLDLIITSDTATAHLAGALGVPTWVAISDAPEWRWMIERDDSPWYPTMKLFRQPVLKDWLGAFINMARDLPGEIERLRRLPACGLATKE